jgi:hypothetical protein
MKAPRGCILTPEVAKLAKTVAEVLWDTLVEHGVEYVFGILTVRLIRY